MKNLLFNSLLLIALVLSISFIEEKPRFSDYVEGELLIQLKPEIADQQMAINKICQGFEDYEFNEALKEIWKLISFCDKYIEENKPWQLEDEKLLIEIFSNLIYTIRNIGEMLSPLLPETSERILSSIGNKKDKIDVINKEILFPRCS